MTIRMLLNQKEIELLEENGVEYTFWDFEEILNGQTENVEIEFDSNEELEKAKKIVGK